MSNEDTYAGREQTLVKHFILKHYLERFAHIVGSSWNAITYVDCFSGPWNVRSQNLEDSSFALAIEQLRVARNNLHDFRIRQNKPPLAIRCYFLEKDPDAFAKLERFSCAVSDIEISIKNAALEDSIDDILRFARQRSDAFPFIFVDPTGWTGFGLDVIAPLLRLRPGEVLINFMTNYVVRFAESEDPAIRESFDRLFGPIDYRSRIKGLAGRDREDELVECYREAIRVTGNYDFVCPAIVLQPETARTHFHLLYATRSARGVEVFKQVEKQAMEVMERARANAGTRSRQSRTGQLELLSSEAMHDPRYYESLRDRYARAARTDIERLLRELGNVAYDDAWISAVSHPLVWESDLKSWIADWKRLGNLELSGLRANERVAKHGKGHKLVWKVQQ